ncbi:MAG: hypothetical protein GY789_21365 [Hyphomicrobiales bacterium]|nr:hypothetical protein [Hyphomicrobiales bacterium]
MVQQTSGREKEKGITQSPIVHMARKSLFVYLVMEMAFVSIREVNTLVRGVKVAPPVSMGNIKGFAGIVMVVHCAKPHTVLPPKIRNMMATVGIALPIFFRIRLLYGIIGQRRPLFLKESFLMLPGSATKGLKMGAPREGLTFSWIWEITS